MPLASRSLLLLAAATASLFAGCTVDATGFRVTVRTHGITADRIDVTVLRSAENKIGSGSYSGTIEDGATFGVQLPDSLDGASVTVTVEATRGGMKVGSGSAAATVAKQKAVALTIDLMGSVGADMTTDQSMADLTKPVDSSSADLTVEPDLADAAMVTDDLADGSVVIPPDLLGDLATPDLTVVDMVPPPDLTQFPDLLCEPSCMAGNYSYCDGNGKRQVVPCGFGCNGPQCTGPNTCNTAGDISNPGTYWATTLGSPATQTGSCQGVMGPDNTLKFTTKAWNKVTLSLNASFPASLFARASCGDTRTEYMAYGGLCTMMNFSPACVQGNQMEQLVLCGVAPGQTSYAFVEHPAGMGGLYGLTTTFAPLTLNDCPNAGMLWGPNFGSFSYTGDTSGQQNLNAAQMGAPNCGDRGATSPEMVFWLPIGAQIANKTVAVTVTGLNGFSPLLYTQSYCQPATTTCFLPVNNVATAKFANVAKDTAIFFFVDGQGGAKGQFKLDMVIN